jgi:hypothetical protein
MARSRRQKSFIRPILATFIASTLGAWGVAALPDAEAVNRTIEKIVGTVPKVSQIQTQKKSQSAQQKSAAATTSASKSTRSASQAAASFAGKWSVSGVEVTQTVTIKQPVPPSSITSTVSPQSVATPDINAAVAQQGDSSKGASGGSQPVVNDPPTYSVAADMAVPSTQPDANTMVGGLLALTSLSDSKESGASLDGAGGSFSLTQTEAAVPEPGTLAMLALVIAGAGVLRRQRRRGGRN